MPKGVIDRIGDVFIDVFNVVLLLLPNSPFRNNGALAKSAFIKDILGYVNYYIPFSAMSIILTAWLSAIIAYYAYSIILRYIKAIK